MYECFYCEFITIYATSSSSMRFLYSRSRLYFPKRWKTMTYFKKKNYLFSRNLISKQSLASHEYK